VVDGQAGLVARFGDRVAVLAFVVDRGQVTHLDIVANPEKLTHLTGGSPS